MKIAIDLRMLRHSGITSYLVNTLPHLIRDHPEAHFYLLGDPRQMDEHAWTHAENVTRTECIASIYSLSEQWKVARRVPRDSDLLWCPHYNIPLLYRGNWSSPCTSAAPGDAPVCRGRAAQRAYARIMFTALRRKATIMCGRASGRGAGTRIPGPEARLHVIYLGVSESWFHVEKGPRPHERPTCSTWATSSRIRT